jgi:hypothetical protein
MLHILSHFSAVVKDTPPASEEPLQLRIPVFNYLPGPGIIPEQGKIRIFESGDNRAGYQGIITQRNRRLPI